MSLDLYCYSYVNNNAFSDQKRVSYSAQHMCINLLNEYNFQRYLLMLKWVTIINEIVLGRIMPGTLRTIAEMKLMQLAVL